MAKKTLSTSSAKVKPTVFARPQPSTTPKPAPAVQRKAPVIVAKAKPAAKPVARTVIATRKTPVTPVSAPTTAATKKAKVTTVATTKKAAAVKVGSKVSDVGKVTKNPGLKPGATQPGPTLNRFTRRILRPADLLELEFTFVNLRLEKPSHGPHQLRRITASQAAYVVVGFPPQHVQEQAFFETAAEMDEDDPASEEPTADDIPVKTRLAGPSRLVFRLPAGTSTVPYDLSALLAALSTYELSVAPTATPPPSPRLSFQAEIAPSLSTVAVSKAVAKKSAAAVTVKQRSAQLSASQAYAASVSAEAHGQWHAKRSPLTRAGAHTAELQAAKSLLEKIKPLRPPKLAEPTDVQTAIEAPTRLILSPSVANGWVHAVNPVASAQTGRVELWHTRLAVRLTNGTLTERDDYRRAVRAIWALDPPSIFKPEEPLNPPPHANTPFRATLDAYDRHNLVHLSANPNIKLHGIRPVNFVPLPVDVDNLMLTTLGAWLNLAGAWTPPNGLSVESWRHRATMARDHYVRVVYAGFLYPFGNRASLIKVTERKFHTDRAGNPAFLRQRMFIVVREPYRLLGNTGLKRPNGESLDLQMPFKSVRILTLVTPNLNRPEESDLLNKSQGLFWPWVGSSTYPFQIQLEDESGALIDLTAPLLFLGKENLEPNGAIKTNVGEASRNDYNGNAAGAKPRRRRPLQGQRVQLAPTPKTGDTSFELDAVEFNLEFINGKLVPFMASAAATIPTLKHLARSQAKPEISFPSVFLKSPGGFAPGGANPNPGEVFLQLADANATKLDFSKQGDRAGGFIAPNLAISGLSRKLGPIGGGIEAMAKTGLDPMLVFGGLGDLMPKLFGCIKITDILDFAGLDDLTKLPRFVTENLTAAQALLGDIQRIQGHLATLQGQLPGLGAQANDLGTAAGAVLPSLQALLGDPLSDAKREDFKTKFGVFITAAKALRNGLGGLAVPEEVAFARTQLEQLLDKIVAGLEDAADVIAMVDRIADTLEDLNELRLKFEWKPVIKNWPASKPIFEIKPGGGLVIAVELNAQSGASKEPSLSVACRLAKFDLNLINPVENFIKLKFRKIEFTASSRKKPDVNVDFDDIEFVGVLSFVETLRTLIPLDGFSDPPYLEVTEQGVEAGFSLGLPNIAIGVFSLSNVSLGAALAVPFIGNQPLSVRFNFCERSDPFRLTVWVFGGGGFFAITITPAGVQILEAAFEFGAAVSLDFGVASGSVSVMAGVYYRMESDEASLTGYFNLKGRVSVLGLITASLELSLELTYEFSSGKCKGRASLIIEVEVLLFSASVEVVCERKFKGSNGDPSFVQIMAPYTDPVTAEPVEPWVEYCNAYAA